jgi:sortase A
MTAIRAWLAMFIEYALLGVALGCFGMYAIESVEARRFQAEQTAAFEQAAKTQAAPARVHAGGLVGMLDVPRLKLTTPVVEGDDEGILKKAVGHLPDTPMPWEHGNSAMAAHRDGLFRPLKDVKIGDEITFRTTRDEYRYRVTSTAIVTPDDVSVLAPKSDTSLTLITCYPFYYVGAAPKRFIVHARREPSQNRSN